MFGKRHMLVLYEASTHQLHSQGTRASFAGVLAAIRSGCLNAFPRFAQPPCSTGGRSVKTYMGDTSYGC